ncbi:MAG: hypothetical protein SGILL_003393, partial [Bacillariaceae sp.]
QLEIDRISWLSPLPSAGVDSIDVTEEEKDETDPLKDGEEKKSFWKSKAERRQWQERKRLEDLHVGQELTGYVFQELLDGRTCPKLFFECGVGRINKHGDWKIVTGMLRLPRGKTSVTKKRAARYRKKGMVQLFVSRIQKECCRLEVCASVEELEKYTHESPKVPVGSLQRGQIIEGTIFKLHPYGATVDIGANRRGLLHIKKVAELYGKYIDKEKGLEEAGIEKDARVKLMVESVQDRRVFLAFTPDVKREAQEALASQQARLMPQSQASEHEDLDLWAEYASQQETSASSQEPDGDVEDPFHHAKVKDDEEDHYDDYDEQNDIEEALGLDMY